MNHLAFLSQYSNLNILFTPLNWGLGHATRSAVLIDHLQKRNQVYIGSDGMSLEWLHRRYPTVQQIELPSYSIEYNSEYMWWNMVRAAPTLGMTVRLEHGAINHFIKKKNIDLVISDHRLGCYTNHCKCIIIAHQIHIPHHNRPLANLISKLNRQFLNRYNEVWIPDDNNKLSGNLSSTIGINNPRQIGALSLMDNENRNTKETDILLILSGPEPSRSQLELLASKALLELPNCSKVLIRGTNSERHICAGTYDQYNEVIDMASADEINSTLLGAQCIICRSGYSTIMDLAALNRSAILIPTPGQPEQEYLGLYHAEKGHRQLRQSDVSSLLVKKISDLLLPTSPKPPDLISSN